MNATFEVDGAIQYVRELPALQVSLQGLQKSMTPYAMPIEHHPRGNMSFSRYHLLWQHLTPFPSSWPHVAAICKSHTCTVITPQTRNMRKASRFLVRWIIDPQVVASRDDEWVPLCEKRDRWRSEAGACQRESSGRSSVWKWIEGLTPHDVAARESEDQGTAPNSVHHGVSASRFLHLHQGVWWHVPSFVKAWYPSFSDMASGCDGR